MLENSIPLPESLLFYLVPQNRMAVERLAAQKVPPPALSWDMLEDFYATRFSHHVIKYEYYLFLRDAWKATWGKAIEQRKVFSLLSVGEHSDQKAALSPEEVWGNEFVRAYKYNDETCWFGITLNDERNALHLCWYSEKGEEKPSLNFDLPLDFWEAEPDKREWRVTVSKACPVAAKMENIDLSQLQQAAANLIKSRKPYEA